MRTNNSCGSMSIPFPAPMDFGDEGAVAERWRLWLQNWRDFSILVNLKEQSEVYQLAMFRQSIGDDGRRIINSFNLPEHEQINLEKIIQNLQKYCISRLNQTYERFKFN